MFIIQKYIDLSNTPSDINEHLPTLFELAKEINSIVEMGTRNCNSTTAFLAAIVDTDKTLISYDLYRSPSVDECEKFENFKFYKEDTLDLTIPNVDLLFIDTLHTYFQLTNELNLHSKNVNKYIVLHDTTVYAHFDEAPYPTNECSVMSNKIKQGEKRGIKNALDDFLLQGDGLNWCIHKVYENNNGLTILKRK
jgi:hypothetical protein